ncbi:MAG: dethiobiotin synthase [Planctomycetales bacterium]|nr:dethiobiotin synthase [Planctomycetales bacterium]
MIKGGLFFVGTDTDVGKTYFACRLAEMCAASGISVGVYKPTASGLAIDSPASDPYLLRQAARLDVPLERVCPQNFLAPIAPPLAAEQEDRSVDEELLLSGAQWWFENCSFLICEGAGGLLSPLSHGWCVLDLVQEIKLPVMLIARNKLGALNSILLTVRALEESGMELEGIVLNQLPQDIATTLSVVEGNWRLLQHWLPHVRLFRDIGQWFDSQLPSKSNRS